MHKCLKVAKAIWEIEKASIFLVLLSSLHPFCENRSRQGLWWDGKREILGAYGGQVSWYIHSEDPYKDSMRPYESPGLDIHSLNQYLLRMHYVPVGTMYLTVYQCANQKNVSFIEFIL